MTITPIDINVNLNRFEGEPVRGGTDSKKLDFGQILDSKLDITSSNVSTKSNLLISNPLLFLEEVKKSEEVNITDIGKKFLTKIDGQNFNVDFKNDYISEYNIGLSDVLPINAKKVKVSHFVDGQKIELSGTRKSLDGGFYTEGGRYIPIYSGYKIEVTSEYSDSEIRKIESIIDNEKSAFLKDTKFNAIDKTELEKITLKALKNGIDPSLIVSMRILHKNIGSEFGINREGINNFDSQLNYLCRIIENQTQKYSNTFQINPFEGGMYSPEFLAILGQDNKLNYSYNNYEGRENFNRLFENYNKLNGIILKNDKIINTRIDTFLNKNVSKIRNLEIINKTTPEKFIENAYSHIGKPYIWGAGRGKQTSSTDCSGLILMTGKSSEIFDSMYDNNAEGLSKLTLQKNPAEVEKGDLVFILDGAGKITHVEIALGKVNDGKIPIIDASKSVGKVSTRTQSINSKVMVGKPIFYI